MVTLFLKSKCQIKILYMTCALNMPCSCSVWNSEADLPVPILHYHEVNMKCYWE